MPKPTTLLLACSYRADLMEAGSINIPNLEALREELSDEFAKELVSVFADSPTAEESRQRLKAILTGRPDAEIVERTRGIGADDPVA